MGQSWPLVLFTWVETIVHKYDTTYSISFIPIKLHDKTFILVLDDERASGHSSRRNSDDSDSSVKSIENITDVMNRRTKMRMTRSATGTRRSNRIINYVDNSSSEDDDEGVTRYKHFTLP